MSSEMTTEYPENEKLASFSDERSAIGDFLEWLRGQNLWICDGPGEFRHYYPVSASDDTLIMKFLEIDEVKLEQERRDMLGRYQ